MKLEEVELVFLKMLVLLALQVHKDHLIGNEIGEPGIAGDNWQVHIAFPGDAIGFQGRAGVHFGDMLTSQGRR